MMHFVKPGQENDRKSSLRVIEMLIQYEEASRIQVILTAVFSLSLTFDLNLDYFHAVCFQSDQATRLQSIIRILAHYETEKLNPFSIFGVTITRDLITLVRNEHLDVTL